MVAFANTDGGKLLIGVKDNGNIAGVRSEEEYYMIESAAGLFCEPEVSFSSKKWNIEGKAVLEVNIPQGEQKPYFVKEKDRKKIAYIRVGDQNLAANKILLDAWKKKKRKKGTYIKFTYPVNFLFQYLDENSTITLRSFCRSARIRKHMAEKILSDLVALDIIKIIFTEKGIYYALEEDFDISDIENEDFIGK